MSTCYTYLGIALRSAIQMGLHRRVTAVHTPIERQTRCRLFWVLRKMDIYVSTLLGLPCGIADDDIDQEMPLEIDDEYLLESISLPQPAQRLARMAATNAHIKLTGILKKVVAYVYPIKGVEQTINGSSEVYLVEDGKIDEIEVALQGWVDTLPETLHPSAQVSDRLSSGLLQLSYQQSRLFLYRPFMHYFSCKELKDPSDFRAYTTAIAGLNASWSIIRIASELKDDLLNGGHWFVMYSIFFAVYSLLYYALESSFDDKTPAIFEAADQGRQILDSLRDYSLVAERCSVILKTTFDRLPVSLLARLHEAKAPRSSTCCRPVASPEPSLGTGITGSGLSATTSFHTENFQTMGYAPSAAPAFTALTQLLPPNRGPLSLGCSFHVCTSNNDSYSLGSPGNTKNQPWNSGTPSYDLDGPTYSCGRICVGSIQVEAPVGNGEQAVSSTALSNSWEHGPSTQNANMFRCQCFERDSELAGAPITGSSRQGQHPTVGACGDVGQTFCGNPATERNVEGNALRANVHNAFHLGDVLDIHSWKEIFAQPHLGL